MTNLAVCGASSWELVTAAQNGNREAFGQLYDRYVDTVFRYVLGRVGNRPLAEDVTSETFLRALRSISSVTYQGRDISAWLITIARNIIADYRKSSRFHLEFTVADLDDTAVSDSDPESELVAREIAASLWEGIAQLLPDQQTCIKLRFIQGFSVAETAAVMGRSGDAIKALQHRGVRKLAQLLPTEVA